MTIYKRSDIVLVPFPFSDQTAVKKRPAVVVSSDNYNNASYDIVIMAITGQIEQAVGIGECLIEDWKNSGLLKPSAIKPALSTIEKKLILKRLGGLSLKDISSMEKALKAILELS